MNEFKPWNEISDSDLDDTISELKLNSNYVPFGTTAYIRLSNALLHALKEIKNLRWQLKVERMVNEVQDAKLESK